MIPSDESDRNSIPAGETLLFSHGEYDDYRVVGLFTTVKALDEQTIHEAAVLCEPVGQTTGSDARYAHIAQQLVTTGYLVQIAYFEVHLGCDGQLTPSGSRPELFRKDP